MSPAKSTKGSSEKNAALLTRLDAILGIAVPPHVKTPVSAEDIRAIRENIADIGRGKIPCLPFASKEAILRYTQYNGNIQETRQILEKMAEQGLVQAEPRGTQSARGQEQG